MDSLPSSLKHQFLIAMPHMDDTNFAHTLIYLVEHNHQGAMGLVVNRPSTLSLGDLLRQLRPETAPPSRCEDIPIYKGGPVQTERGFVLHTAGARYQATLSLGELFLSTSLDALFDIADSADPGDYLITLGYAGWDSGQLENEVARNDWLTCPAETDILFRVHADQRRATAAGRLGVDLQRLSHQTGHA